MDELFRLYDDDSLRPESLYGENSTPWNLTMMSLKLTEEALRQEQHEDEE